MSAKRPLKGTWIDDDPRRENGVTEVGRAGKLDITFMSVRGTSLGAKVGEMLNGPQQDVVVIDHFLNNAELVEGIGARGSTVADIIRDKWPTCPIIGVSAAQKVGRARALSKNQYDALYSYLSLKSVADYLPIVAAGFRSAAECIGENEICLISLLEAPEGEDEVIRATMPEDLRAELDDDTLPGRLFRWVHDTLLGRPGLTYDRLWAATLFGIKQDSLDKVSGLLEGALYRGVFRKPHQPRWWRDTLKTTIYAGTEAEVHELPWEAARRLPGISADDYSKCASCGKDLPDTVAFVDVASEERRQVHRRCTRPHPGRKKEPFFEEIRVMG